MKKLLLVCMTAVVMVGGAIMTCSVNTENDSVYTANAMKPHPPKKCIFCNGTGWKGQLACSHCKGTGKIG